MKTIMQKVFAMMTRSAFLLAALFCLAAAAPAGEGLPGPVRDIADLNGKRLGVIAGTMLDEAANDALDYTRILYYDDSEKELAALFAGEIDAMVDDEPVVRFLAANDPRLRMLPENMQDDDYAIAVRLDDANLRSRISDAIALFKRDGTIDEMTRRWVDAPAGTRQMPELPSHGQGPVLRLGSSPVSAPFAYQSGGEKIIGFDIELMERIAHHIGCRLVVESIEFSNLIPALLAGEVDAIASCISVTEERSQIVAFSESYYRGGVAVLVLAEEGAAASE